MVEMKDSVKASSAKRSSKPARERRGKRGVGQRGGRGTRDSGREMIAAVPLFRRAARVLRLCFLFSPGPLLTALAHAAIANQHQLEQVVVVALRLRGEGARGEQRGGGTDARAAAPAERAR